MSNDIIEADEINRVADLVRAMRPDNPEARIVTLIHALVLEMKSTGCVLSSVLRGLTVLFNEFRFEDHTQSEEMPHRDH